jgi:hypothetical protein
VLFLGLLLDLVIHKLSALYFNDPNPFLGVREVNKGTGSIVIEGQGSGNLSSCIFVLLLFLTMALFFIYFLLRAYNYFK